MRGQQKDSVAVASSRQVANARELKSHKSESRRIPGPHREHKRCAQAGIIAPARERTLEVKKVAVQGARSLWRLNFGPVFDCAMA
jgi:hypothetical protein